MRAYEQALQPKGLVTYAGGHFGAYADQFGVASTAARDWFGRPSHLAGTFSAAVGPLRRSNRVAPLSFSR